MKKIDCPHIKGWLTLPEAGMELKISRQSMFQRAESGKLTSLCYVPGSDPDKRPAAYLVSRDEVDRLLAEQRAAQQAAAERAQAAEAKAAVSREPAALAS
jgi:hypothetical protein